ncbi:MAG: carbohydrate ABC transporter permease [Candidatus Sumerlaeaceae bacterium]
MRSTRRSDYAAAAGFLAPNLVGFVVFTAGPVLFSLVVSLSNWNLQRTVPFRWIALDNFTALAHNSEFWLYVINTIYLMLGIPLAIAGSLVLALLLNQPLRGVTFYRTIFYLPSITSGVALMILWKALYNPEFGPINAGINWALHHLHVNDLLGALGISPARAPQWLLSTRNLLGLEVERVGLTSRQWGVGARDAIVVMGIWIAIGGNNMLLYMAALGNVPRDLLEAASIDGASRWQMFRNVTWPQLAPTTFFIVVMSFIGGLQGGFEQGRIMTGNGGPAGTTTTLTAYIYNKGFEEFQIGYASAVAWVVFVAIFAVTLLHWRYGNSGETE